jgi:hypothetical protein
MSEEYYEMEMHPLDSGYVCKLALNEFVALQNTDLIETIVLMDKSGHMEVEAQRIASQVLMQAFYKLSYDPSHQIHVVPFSIGLLQSQNVRKRLLKNFKKHFQDLSNNKPVRLLMVSDGGSPDVDETLQAAADFAKYLRERDFIVSSQSIRLFTGDSNPDEVKEQANIIPAPIDVLSSESDEAIAEKIADLFIDDKLDYHQVLQAKSKILLKTPWDSSPSDQILLKPGDNIFWLTEAPEESMSIEDTAVENVSKPPLSLDSFQMLVKDIQNQVTDQLKLLKVEGTTEAEEKIYKLEEYFKETEGKLE